MDFIERWFGISPDAGNGLTEVSCEARRVRVTGFGKALRPSPSLRLRPVGLARRALRGALSQRERD